MKYIIALLALFLFASPQPAQATFFSGDICRYKVDQIQYWRGRVKEDPYNQRAQMWLAHYIWWGAALGCFIPPEDDVSIPEQPLPKSQRFK